MEISISPLENQRNWLDLPRDLTLTILKKLEVTEILKSAQFVCKSWYVLCKEPSVRNTIRLYDFGESESDLQFEENKYTGMMVSIVDSNDTDLFNLGIKDFALKIFYPTLHHGTKDFQKLVTMPLNPNPNKVTTTETEVVSDSPPKNNRNWSELPRDITDNSFKFNQLGSKCPDMACNDEALAISKNMPELRHLQIIGNSLTDVGLRAILDGCPHLQSACMFLLKFNYYSPLRP
ncbi:putative F-box protein At4g05475 [Silene latifolia]|uniref:putative F-box protein At4g05475 n=1 Tax=Silene latifolia TaxID=37657 RepID=UPI003D77951B